MKVYGFLAFILRGWFKFLFNVKVEGCENIPKDSGIIVASNHRSNFDPPFVACFLPVRLTFMAKEELFHFKPLGFILRKCGAFPIKRGGGDISAMKQALKILNSKCNMLIFPEGTRCSEKNKILKGKSGAALLAYKSGARLLPVGISGEYKFRKKLYLKIGEPIDISEFICSRASSADLQGFTDKELMERIRILAGAEAYGN